VPDARIEAVLRGPERPPAYRDEHGVRLDRIERRLAAILTRTANGKVAGG
jgi:hypothetical protein